MHGVELVGLDLDAPARQFTFDRDGLKAAFGKLRLQRLFLDARHWSATSWPPKSTASYRRPAPVLNGEQTRSQYGPGAAPSVFLRVAIRGYRVRRATATRRVRLRPPISRLWPPVVV